MINFKNHAFVPQHGDAKIITLIFPKESKSGSIPTPNIIVTTGPFPSTLVLGIPHWG